MDDKILITREDGTEVEMTILFTYDSEDDFLNNEYQAYVR